MFLLTFLYFLLVFSLVFQGSFYFILFWVWLKKLSKNNVVIEIFCYFHMVLKNMQVILFHWSGFSTFHCHYCPCYSFEISSPSWVAHPSQYFIRFKFHAKVFNYIVLSANVAISTTTHGKFCWSSSQSDFYVFLCLKSWYILFFYNQKSRSSH
jgi:hypothetical protein